MCLPVPNIRKCVFPGSNESYFETENIVDEVKEITQDNDHIKNCLVDSECYEGYITWFLFFLLCPKPQFSRCTGSICNSEFTCTGENLRFGTFKEGKKLSFSFLGIIPWWCDNKGSNYTFQCKQSYVDEQCLVTK